MPRDHSPSRKRVGVTDNSLSRPRERAGVRVINRWIVAAILVASTHTVHAALFDDDEARKRIVITNQRIDQLQNDLEARLVVFEQQFKGQGLELLNQFEILRTDIAKIRGQIEVLTFELTEAQKRQRDLYVDLDTRLRKLETAPVAVVPAVGDVSAPTADPSLAAASPSAGTSLTIAGTEQRAYDGALDLFKRGDYPNAITGFGTFVKTYPRSPLAASAQYWVGNAQFARKDYRAAIAAQRQLILTYPDSTKVPDALLNIASAQSELGDNGTARRTLEELIGKYPQSESAVKAKQRLGVR